MEKIEEELKIDEFRRSFLIYTRKAFKMLPNLENPCILDIGCGSGIPTLELATLSNGKIIGIDIDQNAISEFKKKIKDSNLSKRIKALNLSLFDVNFPKECFDIIWAEGAVGPIGFEKALRHCKRLLKPNGFMVIHDDLKKKEEKLEMILKDGYELHDMFELPEDTWGIEYYQPLEIKMKEFRIKHKESPQIMEKLKKYQDEINAFKNDPSDFKSIFYIIKRI